MDNLVLIFLLSVGILAAVGLTGLFFLLLVKRRRKAKSRMRDNEAGEIYVDKVANSQQHFQYNSPAVQKQDSVGDDYISECLTCSLIQMGSSVSYSDNTCPQCGANTTKTYLG